LRQRYLLPLCLLLGLSLPLSLPLGEVRIPLPTLFHPTGVYWIILERIRLPTVISAALIGASLSVSGAIMQLLLRNPLMDPYVTGTAAGGAFGAVLAYFLLAFNLPLAWISYVAPEVAFAFALLSTLITVLIGRRSGVYGLVVGGIVVSYLFSSLITVLVTLIQVRFPQVPPLEFWLLGEVLVIGWVKVTVLGALTSLLLVLGIRQARRIDLASISDEMSHAAGLSPSRFRVLWIGLVSLVTAYVVSTVGIIGFLGIIVPHVAKRIGGGSATHLIPSSAILGAVVLIWSNVLSNGVLGMVIPVTAITSILATPVIVYVLVSGSAREGAQG